MGAIVSEPNFDVACAPASQRMLLGRTMDRLAHLIETVDRTLQSLEGKRQMDIAEYYAGFNVALIEELRQELKQQWGEDTLRGSESRVTKRGKESFSEHQEKGGAIFSAIAELIPQGPASPAVQQLIAGWREWLPYVSTYSDEAVLGLGPVCRQDPRFAAMVLVAGGGALVWDSSQVRRGGSDADNGVCRRRAREGASCP